MLPGKGSVVGQRLVEHPDVRKIVFTGSTEVGKGVMAGCAAQVKRVTLELGGKSANVVFADADLERAAADRALRRLRQRRAGLLRPVADPGPALGLRPVPGAARARGAGRARRGPGARDGRDGPADQPRPVGAGRLLRAGRRAGGLPRQRARRPRLLVPADGARPGRPAGPRGHRGDLRPGRRRRAVRRRGRRRPDRQRGRVRPVRLDLDPRRRAGRCASRAASRPATCRSTATRRCATRHRSAASSSRGWAASWAPTRWTRSPTRRTSSSSTEG